MTADKLKKDREIITEELSQIVVDGVLHPHNVVRWAGDHPESLLYSYFEWDDTKAAENYRIWQARKIIELQVTMIDSSSGPKTTRLYVSLTSDRLQGGGYREVVAVMRDENRRNEYVADVLDEFTRIEEKYKTIAEVADMFKGVFKEVEKVRKKLRKREAEAVAMT